MNKSVNIKWRLYGLNSTNVGYDYQQQLIIDNAVRIENMLLIIYFRICLMLILTRIRFDIGTQIIKCNIYLVCYFYFLTYTIG